MAIDITHDQERCLPKFAVTEARLVDLPAMVALLQQLFSRELDFEPAPTRQAAALDMLLKRPETGRLFIATADARVLGMVSVLFTISTATGGCAGWVEDLVVDCAVRGHGVGSALLDHVIAWSRREGLTRLTLLTDHCNEGAQRLYASRGFATSHMIPLRLALR